jgi:hypothetical protein
MSHAHQAVHVFINQTRVLFEHRQQTGRKIKKHADLPLDHVLCLEVHHKHSHDECGCEKGLHGHELEVIADDQEVELENGQHFWSHPAQSHRVTVTINRKEYEFANAHQTGLSLKERAGIASTDVLFLDRPNEDEVIADTTKVVLKCGDCFHSGPPADYGAYEVDVAVVGALRFEFLPQADGWQFLVVEDYPIPDGYSASSARLLVKLPPGFPDAAPDMFWLSPAVLTAAGASPQGATSEVLLGQEWQRFSWHLRQGAWQPGISTLRDYMRCIRARLEKRN